MKNETPLEQDFPPPQQQHPNQPAPQMQNVSYKLPPIIQNTVPEPFEFKPVQPVKPAQHVQQASSPLYSKRNWCGIIVASILDIYNLIFFMINLNILFSLISFYSSKLILPILLTAIKLTISACFIYFYFKILSDPKYLMGKPEAEKFIPHWIATSCVLIFYLILLVTTRDITRMIVNLIIDLVLIGLSYSAYSQDDFGKSACLCLKPFVAIKPLIISYQMFPGYGYPHQNQMMVLDPQGYHQPSSSYQDNLIRIQ